MINTDIKEAKPRASWGDKSEWKPGSPDAVISTLKSWAGFYPVCDKNISAGDLPGGPVTKTPPFHCRGPRFDPWLGNLRFRMPHSGQTQTNKKTRDERGGDTLSHHPSWLTPL